MMKTPTTNDELKFLYGEVTESERQSLNNKLILNESLQEELFEFGFLKNQIDQVLIPAPQRVVDKIMNFVRASNLESA